MPPVNLLKFSTSSPSDTASIGLLQKHGYNPDQVLGVVGKTEGNGCVNDFSRTLSAHAWDTLIPPWAITIFSGGTEGVLTPHLTFVVQHPVRTGLVASVGRTQALQPHEIGTAEHVKQVSLKIKNMIADLVDNDEIKDLSEVQLVLIKCPLLTSARIAACKAQGLRPVTEDTYESMAKSRYASAAGVAVALDQLDISDLEARMEDLPNLYSDKASCSSGAELDDCHILILASSPPPALSERLPTPQVRAISGVMKDAIDAAAIIDMTKEIENQNGKMVQVFVKAEADPTGMIRGKRHTMNTDSDIQSTRHARAAVGGLVAGLVGDTEIYVSGGAEGQGPDGGGSLCMVYSVE